MKTLTPLPKQQLNKSGDCSQITCDDVTDISRAILTRLINARTVTIIDANGTKSWNTGHIPGAIDFRASKDLSACLPNNKKAFIVVYCDGPTCNAWQEGAKAAMALGYTNVRHYSGGINDWKELKMIIEVGKRLEESTRA